MMSLLCHTIIILLFELSQSGPVPFSLKYISKYVGFSFDFMGKSLELLKNYSQKSNVVMSSCCHMP